MSEQLHTILSHLHILTQGSLEDFLPLYASFTSSSDLCVVLELR